jgi:hypothetical protein
MRFVAPVGQAIPARSLVAHLVRWLGLPGDGWELCVGDAVLAPLQVLADLAPAAGDLVTLRRRT